MVDDSVVAAIVASADVTEAQVRAVLTALEAVQDGEPVGTIVQNPADGSIAVRVAEGGVPFWKVTSLDGNDHRDLQPKLVGWTVLATPEAVAAPKKQAKKSA
jgi:hypothetical protein